MPSTSQIEIKTNALKNNVDFAKSILEPQTILSAVIKGNAYGHGTKIIIPALEKQGIHHFSVYSSPEAKVALAVKAKNTTIMIMGFIYFTDYSWIIENDIEFFVSNLDELQHAIDFSKKLQKKAIIHIDVETGMNRTGMNLNQLKTAITLINVNTAHLHIKGVTSHFAGAESIANHTRILNQFSIFKKRIKMLNSHNIIPEVKHIASSAAAINYPETQLDLVRSGILIYGYWPTKETFINYIHGRKDKKDHLKRVIRWTTEVVSIKEVSEGQFIGYGLSYQAQHNMTIMIIPVGYCNGYSRSLSNNGHVMVKSQLAPIISTVNMNMIICDITNIKDVKISDKVTLIGKQGENEISFSSFAEMNNSLNYEILAHLPENIDRKIVEC